MNAWTPGPRFVGRLFQGLHGQELVEAVKLQPHLAAQEIEDNRLAPEMAEALRKWVYWHETPETAEAIGITWRDILGEARALLARLEGGAQ